MRSETEPTMHDAQPLRGRGPWQWFRVYYFESRKDDLITGAIGPALQLLRSSGAIAQGLFQRDWAGGPNVLVGVQGARRHVLVDHDAVRLIRGYLAAHPSRTAITAEEYRRRMGLVARGSARADEQDLPLQPNNTVLFDCLPVETPIVMSPLIVQQTRTFLCATTELVVEWLRSIGGREAVRRSVALHAMLALAWTTSPHTLRAYISFRSHVLGFRSRSDTRGHLESVLARQTDDGTADAIRQELRRMLDAIERDEDAMPGGRAYRQLQRSLLVAIASGLRSSPYAAFPFRRWEALMTFESSMTDVDTYRRLFRRLDSDPTFRTWQIVVNLVYLMLNQLGIGALQRATLCHYVAAFAEERSGESAAEIIGRLEATRDAAFVWPFLAELAASQVETAVTADA